MVALLLVIAAALGITLGLLGAGGAIIAVPAFVYVGNIAPTQASGYALFVVMVATLVAAVPAVRSKAIHWPAFWSFGITTMMTVFSIRLWLLPALPTRYAFGDWGVLELDTLLMVAFGFVLGAAGYAMLRQRTQTETLAPLQPAMLAAIGVLVGLTAGLLGVGGGFLMTPALVLWGRLQMKTAVATSIALICVNSAVGVSGDLIRGAVFEWPLVLTFTAFTTAGIVAGARLRDRINAADLRRLFGWVVVAIGIAVLIVELF